MAPRNNIDKDRQNDAGFLSEASPLFQPGKFTSKDLYTSLKTKKENLKKNLYVLLNVTH